MSFFAPLFKPVAYLSLPLFLLHTASNRSPLARYYIRLGLYLSSLGVASIWGAISSIGMTLLGRRLDTNWIVARFFYHLASRVVGIEIELEGEELVCGVLRLEIIEDLRLAQSRDSDVPVP